MGRYRQLIIALLALFIWTGGGAQDTSSTDTTAGAALLGPSKLSEDPSIGFKAGLNHHNIFGDNAEGDPKTGIHFGAYLEYPLNPVMAGKLEVLYSREGYQYRDEKDSLNFMNLDYISIPIIFRYHLGKGLFVEGGPSANLLLGATRSTKEEPARGSITLSNGFRRFSGSNDKELDDLFKSFEVGVEVGVGCVIGKGFEIGLRGDMGLIGIFDIKGGSSSTRNLGGRLSIAKTF